MLIRVFLTLVILILVFLFLLFLVVIVVVLILILLTIILLIVIILWNKLNWLLNLNFLRLYYFFDRFFLLFQKVWWWELIWDWLFKFSLLLYLLRNLLICLYVRFICNRFFHFLRFWFYINIWFFLNWRRLISCFLLKCCRNYKFARSLFLFSNLLLFNWGNSFTSLIYFCFFFLRSYDCWCNLCLRLSSNIFWRNGLLLRFRFLHPIIVKLLSYGWTSYN